MNNYNKIKSGLERLRLLVEQSELWIYKKRECAFNNCDQVSESESNNGEDCAKKDSRSGSVKSAFFKTKISNVELHGDEQVLEELDNGPELELSAIEKYKELYKILFNMINFCVNEKVLVNYLVTKKPRKNDQRLLRNMGVHNIVLELTKISFVKQEDIRMRIIMRTAHEFLQNFCYENPHNQTLLHEILDLTHYPTNEWEAQTATHIFKDNILLCNGINERLIQNFIHGLEHQNLDESKIPYLEFLQTICVVDGHEIKKNQDMIIDELMNSEILHFNSDKMSIDDLCSIMQRKSKDVENDPSLLFHINLVKVLINCTHGKNTFTEIKCHTILSLEDIERVITNKCCLIKVKDIYAKFLYHCHIDTENETKELFTHPYIWPIFENYIQDVNTVLFNNNINKTGSTDRFLESYVADDFIEIIIGFFSSKQFNHIPSPQVLYFIYLSLSLRYFFIILKIKVKDKHIQELILKIITAKPFKLAYRATKV